MDPNLLAQIQDLLLDPTRFGLASSDAWQPLGFVDLDSCSEQPCIEALPPFPVIGIGARNHPVAARLDTVVESPVSVETLIRQVRRTPHAAAVTVQLLRNLQGMSRAQALTFESLSYGLLQGSAEHAAWLAARPSPVQPGSSGRVVVTRHDNVLLVVLDRAAARNAIDRAMRDELYEAFTLAAIDPDIGQMKLRASGAAFSVGGDLDEFGTTRDPATSHLIRSRTVPAIPLIGCADILDVHVRGACVGAGLEIAAFAARFTASSDAWFQLPELAMGLIPGAGGCVSVPHRIGRQRAALMMLSGRRINATTALQWGLIDAIEDEAAPSLST